MDITADLAAYAEDGIPLFDAAIEFLREFSGLVIRFERPQGFDEAEFSGALGTGGIFPEWTEYYSERAGIRLLPAGRAYTGHLTLLIGTDGSWYGGYDYEFGSLGANFLDALENIIRVDGFVERF